MLDAALDLDLVDYAAFDEVFKGQARCCWLMRYMVVQRQPESSRVMIFLPSAAKRLASRLTRWISVPMAKIEPAGASIDDLDKALSAAEGVGFLADFPAALGVDDDLDAGILGADLIDMAGQEALMDGAVAFPEGGCGWRGGASLVCRPARPRGPRPASGRARCPWRGRYCGRGAGRGGRRCVSRAQTPIRRRRGRSMKCRPGRRARPQKALMAAVEFM